MWRQVSALTTTEMIKLAAKRARCRLVDGRPVTLVRWPAGQDSRARVQTAIGKRFTVPAAAIVIVEELPPDTGNRVHVDV